MKAAIPTTPRLQVTRVREAHADVLDREQLSIQTPTNLNLLYGGTRGKVGRDEPAPQPVRHGELA